MEKRRGGEGTHPINIQSCEDRKSEDGSKRYRVGLLHISVV